MRSTRRIAIRRTAVLAGALAVLVAAVASAAGGTGVGSHNTQHGKVLSTSRGYSLYMFAKDKKGGKSTCYGQCAVVWPPLLSTGKPNALRGAGLNPRMLGTTKRSNGKQEVTYNGYPLYTYRPDPKPGATNGEGFAQFGAAWFLIRTNGNLVKCPSGEKASSSGCLPGSY
jgi:predicted lipoprotein with Yx(FWY)xxD motif